MTNKNPFEVRLDVLKIAQDMLAQRYNTEHARYINEVNISQNTKTVINILPVMYSADEVKTTANALYAFIEDKGTRSTSSK